MCIDILIYTCIHIYYIYYIYYMYGFDKPHKKDCIEAIY